MGKPKVLMMCPDLPFPIRAGGQMRMASICEALAGCCNLHIACISSDIPESTRAWAKGLGITVEHYQDPAPDDVPSWYRYARIVMTRNNLRHNPREQLFFDNVFGRIMPDMVWLETPYLLRYVLKWMDKTPVVVDYWGTSEGAKRLFHQSLGLRKIKEWLRWWVGSGCERRHARLLQNIACVSKLDAQYFLSIAPQNRIWPIPIGIAENSTCSIEQPYPEDPLSMILTGDLSYQPNVDATLFFADHIFPRIQSELPKAVFRIVGRNPSPSILELKGRPGIEIIGFVPDLANEICRCAIYVLPMRLGSGIRSKLFDVFPLAKAIVTTSIGAEGLELQHGENCLISDEEMDFAQSCINLLKDEGKRIELGNGAKRLATDVYSQEKINRLVKETVNAVMAHE
jgi:glycosyltransferase involved in cell wall biosynthesis